MVACLGPAESRGIRPHHFVYQAHLVEGIAAVLEAVRTVARVGHTADAEAAPDHPWRLLPEGFDWPTLINDALGDPPIAGGEGAIGCPKPEAVFVPA